MTTFDVYYTRNQEKKGNKKMTERDIFAKVLKIFKDRENYWGDEAHNADPNDHNYQMACLDRAGTYHTAWWVVYYAMQEDWDALNQFDYYN